MDDLTIPFIGPERAVAGSTRSRACVRAGASLAIGSDWSVSSPNPLWEMQVAVERRAPGELTDRFGDAIADVFLPEERVDLATALGAFTMGSAYVNHLDQVTGSIEAGKFADLAVIDQNLFEIPSNEMWKARVELHVRGRGVRLRRRGGLRHSLDRGPRAGADLRSTAVLVSLGTRTHDTPGVPASRRGEPRSS